MNIKEGASYRVADGSGFARLNEGDVITNVELFDNGVGYVHIDEEDGTRDFYKMTFYNFLKYTELVEEGIEESSSKPAHYDTGIDTIAFLRANCPPEQVEGFLRGNALKYLQRYDKKNGVEDLHKAKHYVEMLIEELEGRG